MILAATRSAAMLVTALLVCPPAWAINPPVVDGAAAPPAGRTGPAAPMVQRGECVTTGVLPGSDADAGSPNQAMLNLAGAWQFSRGEGQTVAVIDTGVRPGPRLPKVEPGGDYVGTTDGLTDCDGRGTIVAGIIAGQPGADGFSGVAPAVRVISIRQTSAMYAPRTPGDDPVTARASIDIASLARAVVHAADLGARIINISGVTCLPADNTLDETALGAALRYAALDKDAVIVTAAGNAGPTGLAGGAECQSNPVAGAGSDDPRNWAGVTSVSTPSWWQPYVLSVGSLTSGGQPSAFTMAGPWLGIAAPGENIVSVSNADGGGLADGVPDDRGRWTPVNGTSYAAAYVSGVVALVRSRFPGLSAVQVIERISVTAHNAARAPSNLVGAGTVDPVAALTWELPAVSGDGAGMPAAQQIPASVPPQQPDHTPRTIAFVGTVALALAVGAVAFAAHRRRESAE